MPRILLQLVLLPLPWPFRRWMLECVLGYSIHPTARIGFSIIAPLHLQMDAHAWIGHLTLARGLERIVLGAHAKIGNLNWITGFPKNGKRFFLSFPHRRPHLTIQRHAAIAHRNIIDCTDMFTIGEFSTLAGWWHQVLTHSIDLSTGNQSCAPVSVGRYCFIGTGAILLKGSALPDYSVLGAGSTLTKAHTRSHQLYSGVPAEPVRALDENLAFFTRTFGASDMPENAIERTIEHAR